MNASEYCVVLTNYSAPLLPSIGRCEVEEELAAFETACCNTAHLLEILQDDYKVLSICVEAQVQTYSDDALLVPFYLNEGEVRTNSFEIELMDHLELFGSSYGDYGDLCNLCQYGDLCKFGENSDDGEGAENSKGESCLTITATSEGYVVTVAAHTEPRRAMLALVSWAWGRIYEWRD